MAAAVQPPAGSDERSRTQDALAHIPADDRDLWVRVGMAIKSALGDDGFTLWDEWSRTSERYRETDACSVWRSISADGGVTLGTLFFEAEKYGYVPQRPTAPGAVTVAPSALPAAWGEGDTSPLPHTAEQPIAALRPRTGQEWVDGIPMPLATIEGK